MCCFFLLYVSLVLEPAFLNLRCYTYHITVKNPAHVQKGVTKLIVDGAAIDGNMIPAINGTGHDVTVEVTMG